MVMKTTTTVTIRTAVDEMMNPGDWEYAVHTQAAPARRNPLEVFCSCGAAVFAGPCVSGEIDGVASWTPSTSTPTMQHRKKTPTTRKRTRRTKTNSMMMTTRTAIGCGAGIACPSFLSFYASFGASGNLIRACGLVAAVVVAAVLGSTVATGQGERASWPSVVDRLDPNDRRGTPTEAAPLGCETSEGMYSVDDVPKEMHWAGSWPAWRSEERDTAGVRGTSVRRTDAPEGETLADCYAYQYCLVQR